jgi:hypothetical protein
MSALLDQLLTPEQRAQAANSDVIQPRADRRAPPDALDIATLISRLPTLDNEGMRQILTALGSRCASFERGWIGADEALELIDNAADACESMREITDEDRAEWARDAYQDQRIQEARGN